MRGRFASRRPSEAAHSSGPSLSSYGRSTRPAHPPTIAKAATPAQNRHESGRRHANRRLSPSPSLPKPTIGLPGGARRQRPAPSRLGPRSSLGPMDTGFTAQDAQSDFNRSRRRAALGRLNARLRGQAGDVSTLLPFEEVVEALGRTGERRLGLQTIELDTIVGSVDRTTEFDRSFRPRSARVRARWQRINEAQRKGKGMPPINVFRVGGLHFVEDGHHRVSVARHMGLEVIEAYVTEVITRVAPQEGLRLSDLPAKRPRAAVPRARAARPRAAQADQLRQPRGRLRGAGRDGRGLGVPPDPGPRRAARPARDRPGMVQRRVRSGASRTCARRA